MKHLTIRQSAEATAGQEKHCWPLYKKTGSTYIVDYRQLNYTK